MPSSKSRGNKRSSSFVSTVITAMFIALCVLGVWMLTTNSVTPPQTTSRTSTATGAGFSSSGEQQGEKPEDKKDAPIYEDNPGDLPEDAIKPDDHGNTNNDDKSKEEPKSESSEGNGDNKQEPEPGNDGGGESKNVEYKGKEQEPEPDNGGRGGDSKNDEDKGKEQEPEADNGGGGGGDRKSDEDKGKEQVPEEPHQSDGSNDENKDVKQVEVQEKNSVSEPDVIALPQKQDKKPKQSENEISNDDQKPPLEKQKDTEQLPEQHKDDELQQQNKEKFKQQQQHPEDQQQQPEQPQEQHDQPLQIEFQDVTIPQKETSEKPQNPKTVADDQQSLPKTTESKPQRNQEIQQPTNHEENKEDNNNITDSNSGDTFPVGKNSGIPKESKESKKSWSTQAAESENQKERQSEDGKETSYGYTWELCNVTAGPDYIPCLDNEKAIKQLRTTRHFEHRERHCPEEAPTCLVTLPKGYKTSIEWPQSRDKIWYHNVPHTKLAEVKGHQNWVKVTGEFLTFPGGGTQFIHGALHYIQFLEKAVPDIAWGKHTRVILDVGCGVASFGGYLFDKDVITMSFAPKDEHEAQVQFALERGIPAISAVMGSQRLPFPSRVFDLLHCARCRVPWHAEGGALLLELNRVLRPGGYFVWSATPVYQKLEEDVEIWNAMSALTISICWELVTIKKDKLNSVGAAIYRKPSSNDCYEQRKKKNPPMCKSDDDPNAAWYVPLQSCMHLVPVDTAERGSQWPESWPHRLTKTPYWLNSTQMGIYGKPAPQDFERDYKHWKNVVDKLYMSGLGISWSNVRNVMDMRAVYGGFGAALKNLKVWVMNVVNVDSPDTLPIIYERGLFGIYHDWCESFSSYPRTYDLMHADHLFSKLKKRCKIDPVMAEIDRLVRPGGKLIVRDESSTVSEIENLLKSMHWEVHLTFSKDREGILSAQKSSWRPDSYVASS